METSLEGVLRARGIRGTKQDADRETKSNGEAVTSVRPKEAGM